MDHFACAIPSTNADDVVWWLQALSSGLVVFDPTDVMAKIDGPVVVSRTVGRLSDLEADALRRAIVGGPTAPELQKPYFIGQAALAARATSAARPPAVIDRSEPPSAPPGASTARQADRAPGGWSMPRSYGDSTAELAALRGTAGLIDESALGIFEITGPDAARYLDCLTTNDVAFLGMNTAQYTALLSPDGSVIADAILYRTGTERYLLTTSPFRAERVGRWLQDARSGQFAIDPAVPSRTLPGSVKVRELSAAPGLDALAVVGLAGPNAPAILRGLADGAEDRRKIGRLRRFTVTTARLGGIAVTIARTGHTGAAQGYEIFVHPDARRGLLDVAIARGAEHGLRLVGWDAWSAAGIAAGLPGDGCEMAGPRDISPVEAGIGAEVQAHKPFFVGRAALLAKPFPPPKEVVRFRIAESSGQRSMSGAPVLSVDGSCVGWVTSASTVLSEPVGMFYGSVSAAVPGTGLIVATEGASFNPAIGERGTVDEAHSVRIEVLPRRPK
jgi:aminomethyltransferase